MEIHTMIYKNETNLTPEQIHFLRFILDGKREIEEIEANERLKFLNLDDLTLPCIVACVSPYYSYVSWRDKDNLFIECSNYICNFFAKESILCYCLINSYDNFQLILSLDDHSQQDIEEMLIKLHKKFCTHFSLESFIGLGSSVDKLTEICKSATEASDMLAYKNQYSDKGVINISNTSHFKHYAMGGENIMFSRVIGQFQDGNLAAMSSRLNELIETIRNKKGVSSTAIKRTVIELAVTILHVASNSNVDVDAITNGLDIYTWVLQQNHTEVLTEWLLNLSGLLLLQMQLQQEKSEKQIIKKASDYIISNISDVDLNLQTVSDYIGLSSSYFSQLFKKEKGVGINNFITSCRINEACKKLTETKFSSKEISRQVGFTSATYFGKVFKKNIGVTPNLFRKQNL